jgi:prepilin-type N-terminal cleavage/methylation domain-containing protein
MTSHREHGFTLVETLVSLVILALMLSLLPAAIRMAERQSATTDGLEREIAETAALDAFCHRLSAALTTFERDSTGALQPTLVGDANRLTFVAAAPMGPDGGGTYRYTIASANGSLNLLTERYDANANANGPSDPERPRIPRPSSQRSLMAGILSVTFSYFGKSGETGALGWSTDWHDSDLFPVLIRMELVRDRGFQNLQPRLIELKTALP